MEPHSSSPLAGFTPDNEIIAEIELLALEPEPSHSELLEEIELLRSQLNSAQNTMDDHRLEMDYQRRSIEEKYHRVQKELSQHIKDSNSELASATTAIETQPDIYTSRISHFS